MPALFAGLPLWWACGLGGFIQVIAAAALALGLLAGGRIRAPRGFGLWLLFIVWSLLGAARLDDAERALAFGWRASLYVASTVLFLAVYNAPRSVLPTRRVVNALGLFWAFTVVGGALGMLLPATSFSSPMELLLPASLTENELVRALVHPSTTTANAFSGTGIHRPAAPFPYTNQWGSAFALGLPFAVAALRSVRTPGRRLGLLLLLLLSAVPLVVSFDRGAWLAVGAGLVFAVFRLARAGHRRALGAVLVVASTIALASSVTPLGDLVAFRLERGYGDDKRAELYDASVDAVLDSPLIGHGAPVELTVGGERPGSSPSAGTHGQLWTLAVSHGIPGAGLFLTWMILAVWRLDPRRRRERVASDVVLWCSVAVFAAIVQLPYYALLPWGLPVTMVAAGLAWRELSSAPTPALALQRVDHDAAPGDVATTRDADRWSATDSTGDVSPHQRTEPGPQQPVSHDRDALTTLARGGALSLGGAVINAVLGFVLVTVATRGLGARGTGLLFGTIAICTIVLSITSLGAEAGIIRLLPRRRVEQRASDVRATVRIAVGPPLVASVIAAVALAAFAPVLSDLFLEGADRGVFALRVVALFVPLGTAMVLLLSVTRALGAIVPFVGIQNVLVPSLRPIFVGVAVLAGLGAAGAAVAWALPFAIGCAGAVVASRHLLPRSRAGDAEVTPGLASEFWRFSAPRGLASLLQAGLIWFDILLVNALLSAREAGVYTAANRYVVAGTVAVSAFGVVVGPQVSELLARRRDDTARQVYRVATWWLMALAWPAYVTMAVFAPVLMKLFGPRFEVGADALTILAVSLLVFVGTGNNKVLLVIAGGTGANLAISGLAFALNVGLNLLLLPRVGIEGAAIAWAASIVADNGITAVVLRRRTGLDPFGTGYAVVALAALACFGGVGALCRITLGATPVALACTLAAGGSLYGSLLWQARGPLKFTAFRGMVAGRGPRW